jgi:phage gp46-like protein
MVVAASKKVSVRPTYICDPRDDRCVNPPMSPPFMPGISVRHSPSCADHICNTVFNCDDGNWRITRNGTLDRTKWIEGWVMTQLLTRGFVDCEEHPLGKRGGGWWADAFRGPTGPTGAGAGAGVGFISGSKLWALNWGGGHVPGPGRGATNDLLLMAEQYASEALRPLSRWGIIRTMNVKAIYLTRAINGSGFPGAIMHLRISLVGPGVNYHGSFEGTQMPDMLWLWKEYLPPRPYATERRYYEPVYRQPARL